MEHILDIYNNCKCQSSSNCNITETRSLEKSIPYNRILLSKVLWDFADAAKTAQNVQNPKKEYGICYVNAPFCFFQT